MKRISCPNCGNALQNIVKMRKKLSGWVLSLMARIMVPLSKYKCELCLMKRIEEEILIPTTTFVIISPEYNGSFSGALKLFFDTSRVHLCWWHKTALLVGVATGRAGNLRGMDHLTGVLNHMKVMVHFNKLPISTVDKLLTEDGKITDELTIKAINHQLNEFFGAEKK